MWRIAALIDRGPETLKNGCPRATLAALPAIAPMVVRGRRDRVASPMEAEALLAAPEPRERALWATAFYTGLRLDDAGAAVDLSRFMGHANISITLDRYGHGQRAEDRRSPRPLPGSGHRRPLIRPLGV